MKQTDTPIEETKLDLNIAKRIKLILKENDLSYRELAELLDISKTAAFELANNKTVESVNYKLIVGICYKLGYSPWWLLAGQGVKRAEKSAKIITDIQQFRVELDIRDTKIKIMESHIALLFKEVEYLKKAN